MTGSGSIGRRELLAGLGSVGSMLPVERTWAAGPGTVAILADGSDPVIAAPPVGWAIARLRTALGAKGVGTSIGKVAGDAARTIRVRHLPDRGAEDVSIASSDRETTVGSGGVRGLVYGLVELAERIDAGRDPLAALSLSAPLNETPAAGVRSVLRAFSSDTEDKIWFYDKAYWTGYLDLLSASRFNRIHLALGMAYDYPSIVTDDYFHFPYPFLLDVPGHDVQLVPSEPDERQRNLEMLRFASSEAARRGIDFQLGIWTHAYRAPNSPRAKHRITGLSAKNLAAYCHDALALLLKQCPDITGLTLRTHGESGIPEGDFDFWRTLFGSIASCPRPLQLDLHSKGIDDRMIDMAVGTGKAVTISPKFSAEHQSIGYHQADIRKWEIPEPQRKGPGQFALSEGSRRFTRYGYADYFREDRKYGMLIRVWPGTRRHLMNGDPAQAAAYGRAATFCGASGMEICEPLTFKGRNGSGHSGGRTAYLNRALDPGPNDWAKFAYTYRLMGRALYAPEAEPVSARRLLATEFGRAGPAMESAMGNASRILMLFTTAHIPTGSNRLSWFENFLNVPIVIPGKSHPYYDTPQPPQAQTVSPLDPQLFSNAVEHVAELLGGSPSPRYSPTEVATWMESWADAAEKALGEAGRRRRGLPSAEYRRWDEDIRIQIGLGRFFASRFRAALLYELFAKTGHPDAGTQALAQYRVARDAWAAMAERARIVYVPDVSYGDFPFTRGHWMDRLPYIDEDLTAMAAAVSKAPARNPAADARLDGLVAAFTKRARRWTAACRHDPAAGFDPQAPMTIVMQAGTPVRAAELWYRHVNHAERWRSMAMTRSGSQFRATIPQAYVMSPYPMQYYFVLHGDEAAPVFAPAFNATLSNVPYHTVWKREPA